MPNDEKPLKRHNVNPVPEVVSPAAFPRLLMKLLNDEVAPDALWWLPDGKAFALNPKEVPSKILDMYFRATKFSSFIRRLHNSGFRRTTRLHKKDPTIELPDGAITLSNELFQRDAPHLLESFTLKAVKEGTPQLLEAKGITSENVFRVSRGPGAVSSKDEAALAAVEALAPATAVASQVQATRLDSATVAPLWLSSTVPGSSAAVAATPSSQFSLHLPPSAVDVLHEHARAVRHLHDGIQHLSRGPGLEMQTQLRLDHESSQLRQNLLSEAIRGLSNNHSNQLQLLHLLQHRTSHLDQQQHFQQQHQHQLQRLREAAVSELAIGARGQRTLDDLIMAARVRFPSDATSRETLSLAPSERPSTNNRLRP